MKTFIKILLLCIFLYDISLASKCEQFGFSGGGLFLNITPDDKNSKVVYLCSDVSGIYKSINRGDLWKPINNGLASREIASFAINPSNSSDLFAGTPLGLFRSKTAGKKWNKIANLSFYKHVNYKSIAISKTGKVIVVASHILKGETDGFGKGDFYGSLYKSDNYGKSFYKLKDFNGKEIPSICFDKKSGRLYAGLYWGGLWYTQNYGKTWKQSKCKNEDISEKSVQKILSHSNGKIYAAFDDGLYISLDNGRNFKRSFPKLKRFGEKTVEYITSVCINPKRSNEIFLSSSKSYPIWYNRGSVWFSKDNGLTWKDITGDIPVKNVEDFGYKDGYLYADTFCSNIFRLKGTSNN